jgi:hypothetical protein
MAARARVVLPNGTSRVVQLNAGWLVYEFKNDVLPPGSNPDDFIVTANNNAVLEDWDSLPTPMYGEELSLVITDRATQAPPLASTETPGYEPAAQETVMPAEVAPSFLDDTAPPPPPVVQALCKYAVLMRDPHSSDNAQV